MRRFRAILLAAAVVTALAWPAIATADALLSPRPEPAPKPTPVATAPAPKPTPAATLPVRAVLPADPGSALSSGEITVASAALVVVVGASAFVLVAVRRRSVRDDEGPRA